MAIKINGLRNAVFSLVFWGYWRFASLVTGWPAAPAGKALQEKTASREISQFGWLANLADAFVLLALAVGQV